MPVGGTGEGYRDVQPHLPDNKMERDIISAIEGFEDDEGKPEFSLMRATDGSDLPTIYPRRYNTGPKGVMEDKRQADIKAAMQRRADATLRQENYAAQAPRGLALAQQPGEDEDDEDDDDEDATLRRYRQQRLEQLQKVAQARTYLPTFGELVDMSIDNYIEVVDGRHSETFVVVHLYEPHLPACVRLNFRLTELAAKYDQVCFGAMVATEARDQFPEQELPALIVYRGGQYVEGVERVHESIGDDVELGALQSLLEGMGAQLTSAVVMGAAERAALERYREAADDDEGSGGEGGGGEDGY